jgi:hypothetical protein
MFHLQNKKDLKESLKVYLNLVDDEGDRTPDSLLVWQFSKIW